MKIKDMTGKTFGNLVVVERTNRSDKKGRVFWKYKCTTCGRFIEVRGDNLRRGTSTQCCKCRNGMGKGSRYVW